MYSLTVDSTTLLMLAVLLVRKLQESVSRGFVALVCINLL